MRRLLTLFCVSLASMVLGIGLTTDCQSRPVSSKGKALPSEMERAVRVIQQTTRDDLNFEEVVPQDIIRELIEQVDRERALTDLRRLTGVDPICTAKGCYTITGRETGSEGLQWAKDYVYETLVSLNYSVEVLDWSFEGYSDQNIIARKQGKAYPGEEIYFSAHLDGHL